MAQHGSIRTSKGLQKLQLLRTFNGSSDTFWMIFLESISDLAGADNGLIIEKNSGNNPHKVLATYNEDKNNDSLQAFQKMVPQILEKCSDKVNVFSTKLFSVLAVPLKESGIPTVYILLKIATVNPQEISVASVALTSVADVPLHYHRQLEALRVMQQRKQLLNVLDLNVLLNSQTHFLSAAMLLCNELASAYKCTRVSLGWQKGSYIRLKAMSQSDQFEKKMEIVQKIEAAMEEAAEQNTEIRFPIIDNDGSLYVRDHESYSKAASVELC